MSTLDLHLPHELRSFVDQQVARRGYKNASEFLQSLVEAERHRDLARELETSLLAALDEPSSPLTAADFEDIRRQGTSLIENRRRSS